MRLNVRRFILWGLLVAVVHFVIATVCGVLGHQAGSLTMSGVVLQSVSQIMFFPLYELMNYTWFRTLVSFFPGPWAHLIAFTASLIWGFGLVALVHYIRHRITVRRAARIANT